MSSCIIVEGPDGSGKSTLIKKLEESMGIEAKHDGGPPKTVGELEERLIHSPSHKLLDRWSGISELVYGTVLRGKCMMPKHEIMQYIHDHKPTIIYCRPPNGVLETNLIALERTKAHKSEEHCREVRERFWKIVEEYDLLMKVLLNMGIVVTTYDYTGRNFR